MPSTDSHPSNLQCRSGQILTTILVLGLLFRMSAAISSYHSRGYQVGDDYLGMGRALFEAADRSWVVFPPLYPVICGSAQHAAGEYAVPLLLGLNAVLGTLAVYVVFRIARFWLSPLASLIAAGIAAVDPTLIVATGGIKTEVLYSALILLAVYLTVRVLDSSDWWKRAILAGLLLGASVLTRSIGSAAVIALAFAALLPGWSTYRRTRLSRIIIISVFAGLVTLPWSYLNWTEFGRFGVSCSGAYNVAALWVGIAKSEHEGKIPQATLEIWEEDMAESCSEPNPFKRSEAARRIALEWALNHPVQLLRTIAKSQLRLWVSPWRGEWGNVTGFELPMVLAAALGLWRLLIAITALAGLIWLFRFDRGHFHIWGTLALIIAAHALSVGSAGYGRFLVPIIPFVAVFCAAGVAERRQVSNGPGANDRDS